MSSPPSKKRRSFTLKEKVCLIEESTVPGYSQIHASKKHGIPQSTLACILRDKDKIMNMARSGLDGKKKQRQAEESELEECLYDWFLRKRRQGLLLDDPLLRKQAEEMAKKMNIDSTIQFSRGWLRRRKARLGISSKKQHGEQHSADYEGAQNRLQADLPGVN